ncbi:MAG: LysM peptidoglycan-binding domain-containing protein [Bacteroidales bacterium]|nr:LysM peptidoglycan-binding domain-containing protein [Bacteroidales bacterium]
MRTSLAKRVLGVLTMLICFNTVLLSQEVDKNPIVKSDVVKYIDGKSYYMHEVQKGHTLYSISKVYSVPVEDIIFENPGSKESIGLGQILKILVTSREAQISRSITKKNFDYFFHVATKGETLQNISNIYMVSIGDIEYANQGIRLPLREGEYIKIPVSMQNDEVFSKPKTSVDVFNPKKTKPRVKTNIPKPPETKKLPKQKPLPKQESLPKQIDKKYFNHVVKAKENLYRISREYAVPINELRKANPSIGMNISVGQVIKIPKDASILQIAEIENVKVDQEQKNEYTIHTVGRYETLYGIALKYKVSIEDLKSLNPGLDHGISQGQKIKIPQKKNKKNYIFHKVERNRTSLRRLSKKYKLEVEEIENMNPGVYRYARFGDQIRIPVEPDPEITNLPDTIQAQDISVFERFPNYDSLNCFANSQNSEITYNVALMLPLYLEEIDSLNIKGFDDLSQAENIPSFHFVQMYEGVMLAIDSLKNMGLKLNLHVYDVDRNITKTIKVLQDPYLINMDMIIGPLYSESFTLAANFARLFKIQIINPFAQRQEIISNNPYVFKVQPSIQKQTEQVKAYIFENYTNSKIFLLRHNQYKESKVFAEFSDTLNKIIVDSIKVSTFYLNNLLAECSVRDTSLAEGEIMDSIAFESNLFYKDTLGLLPDSIAFKNSISEIIYSRDSIYGIIENASVKRKNIIIVFSDDKAFVTDILSRINILRDTFDIQLIGLPQWDKIRDLDTEILVNLDFHTFSPSFIDYNDKNVVEFIRSFRSKYKTEPQNFAYTGFDIAWYFLNALMKFGKDFEECLPYYRPLLLQTNYYFDKQSNMNGFENSYWNIKQYKNFEVHKVDNVVFKE